jgi:tRNA(Ile)-lysidine synthase TilS/MesJ
VACAFPLIPCTLCGSQPNIQRSAIKQMLAAWERDYPGRTESIFTALRHVEPATLADPAAVRFRRLRAQLPAIEPTSAPGLMSDAEEQAFEAELAGYPSAIATL